MSVLVDGDFLTIGFDLGGTKMHAAAVDAQGQMIRSEREKTLAAEGADAVIQRMIETVTRLRCNLERGPVRGLCVGVPGAVDEEHGMVHHAPNLGWHEVPLATRLSRALDLPVFLDNDVRVAVLGEFMYGVGRGAHTMVGIFVGTGIGGAIIVDGKLHRGSRGVAGEIGHTVLLPRGPRCSCGRRGHIEALASRTAMHRRVRSLIKKGRKSEIPKLLMKAGTDLLTSSVVEQALAQGDRVMTRVLTDAQYHLGLLAASVANLFDPDVILFGGGIVERLGERFVEPIRARAYKHLLVQQGREGLRIVPTVLKDLAAPLGAAHLARQHLSGSWVAPDRISAPPSS